MAASLIRSGAMVTHAIDRHRLSEVTRMDQNGVW